MKDNEYYIPKDPLQPIEFENQTLDAIGTTIPKKANEAAEKRKKRKKREGMSRNVALLLSAVAVGIVAVSAFSAPSTPMTDSTGTVGMPDPLAVFWIGSWEGPNGTTLEIDFDHNMALTRNGELTVYTGTEYLDGIHGHALDIPQEGDYPTSQIVVSVNERNFGTDSLAVYLVGSSGERTSLGDFRRVTDHYWVDIWQAGDGSQITIHSDYSVTIKNTLGEVSEFDMYSIYNIYHYSEGEDSDGNTLTLESRASTMDSIVLTFKYEDGTFLDNRSNTYYYRVSDEQISWWVGTWKPLNENINTEFQINNDMSVTYYKGGEFVMYLGKLFEIGDIFTSGGGFLTGDRHYLEAVTYDHNTMFAEFMLNGEHIFAPTEFYRVDEQIVEPTPQPPNPPQLDTDWVGTWEDQDGRQIVIYDDYSALFTDTDGTTEIFNASANYPDSYTARTISTGADGNLVDEIQAYAVNNETISVGLSIDSLNIFTTEFFHRVGDAPQLPEPPPEVLTDMQWSFDAPWAGIWEGSNDETGAPITIAVLATSTEPYTVMFIEHRPSMSPADYDDNYSATAFINEGFATVTAETVRSTGNRYFVDSTGELISNSYAGEDTYTLSGDTMTYRTGTSSQNLFSDYTLTRVSSSEEEIREKWIEFMTAKVIQ